MRVAELDTDMVMDIPDIIRADCPYCGMKRARFILIPDTPMINGDLDGMNLSVLYACEGCRGWVEVARTYTMKGKPKIVPVDDTPVSFSPRPKKTTKRRC